IDGNPELRGSHVLVVRREDAPAHVEQVDHMQRILRPRPDEGEAEELSRPSARSPDGLQVLSARREYLEILAKLCADVESPAGIHLCRPGFALDHARAIDIPEQKMLSKVQAPERSLTRR